jgi:hypothetical protein
MDHNANLLQNSGDFVAPMLEFFGLPFCGMEDMHVPSWAFDKRLSPFYYQSPAIQPKPSPGILGACTTCTACGKCAMGPGPESLAVSGKSAWDGDQLVEETISGAVEHVLGRKEELIWSEDRPENGRLFPHSPLPAGPKGIGERMKPYGIVMAQDLPMPPSDDAVPVIPHATIRRHPGVRVPTFEVAGSGSPTLSDRLSGSPSRTARTPFRPSPQQSVPPPILSWKIATPHAASPKFSEAARQPVAPVQPGDPATIDSLESDFTEVDDEYDGYDDAENTLIRI